MCLKLNRTYAHLLLGTDYMFVNLWPPHLSHLYMNYAYTCLNNWDPIQLYSKKYIRNQWDGLLTRFYRLSGRTPSTTRTLNKETFAVLMRSPWCYFLTGFMDGVFLSPATLYCCVASVRGHVHVDSSIPGLGHVEAIYWQIHFFFLIFHCSPMHWSSTRRRKSVLIQCKRKCATKFSCRPLPRIA